jgi:hypothetical protein
VGVNGQDAGSALWAPYVVEIPAALWRPGPNRLTIEVTNSAANHYQGAMRPSGLLTAPTLRFGR